MTRTISSEFPNYDTATLPTDIPDWLTSDPWRNDCCPVWRGRGLELWVDWPNPADRLKTRLASWRYIIESIATAENLYAGDNWAHALEMLQAWGES